MPAELLLIGNPARRRKRSRKARSGARRVSAAQRANRARFAAASRARSRGPRRSRRAAAVLSNPIRRRRRSSLRAISRRRTRRNPIRLGGTMRSVIPMLKNAGTGAVGAIANDIAYGFAVPFLPAMMASPVSATGGINPAYYGGKLGSAILLGLVSRRFLGARAAQMTEGALTVTLRDALKQMIISFGIGMPMGALSPGVVLPPLPLSQNLRKYIGPTAARGGGRMAMYVAGGSKAPTSSREMMTR